MKKKNEKANPSQKTSDTEVPKSVSFPKEPIKVKGKIIKPTKCVGRIVKSK